MGGYRAISREAFRNDQVVNPDAIPDDFNAPDLLVWDTTRYTDWQKTLIGGKVVFDDMMTVYDCTICDLSEGGARVKLNAPVQLPQVFMLRFNDGRIRQCKLRRRYGLELGVEFLD